jgi:hypothetical protein
VSVPAVATATRERAEANARAVQRLCAAEPVLVGVRPAAEAVPGLAPETILTSGPAQDWRAYRGGQREAIVGGALAQGSPLVTTELSERLRVSRTPVREAIAGLLRDGLAVRRPDGSLAPP